MTTASQLMLTLKVKLKLHLLLLLHLLLHQTAMPYATAHPLGMGRSNWTTGPSRDYLQDPNACPTALLV